MFGTPAYRMCIIRVFSPWKARGRARKSGRWALHVHPRVITGGPCAVVCLRRFFNFIDRSMKANLYALTVRINCARVGEDHGGGRQSVAQMVTRTGSQGLVEL